MTKKREVLLANLNEFCKTISEASKVLQRNFDEIQDLDLSKIHSAKEIEWERLKDIESLSSRFARLSDLFIQKLLRIIDEVELVYEGSIIDRLNRAEKKQLIESVELFIEIRDLRNDISHEYLPETLINIFRDVISYTPKLIESCDKAINYAQKLLE
jgi:hypothetical protein